MANTNIQYGWAELTKSYEQPDGSVIVEGRLGGPTEDLDGQYLDKDWLDVAVPKWAQRGNIRSMHQPISAGKAQSVTDTGTDWHLVAKIVDPVEVTKVKAGLYTGFSVGVKNGGVIKTAKTAANGRPLEAINRGDIVEVSLADFPCDPQNTLSLVDKAAAIDDAELAELAYKSAEADLYKRDFSASDRKRLAASGHALPDGSFPIENEEDLHNAVRLVGHAHDKAAAKSHIIARAKAMGATGSLPDDWVGKLAIDDIVAKMVAGTLDDETRDLLSNWKVVIDQALEIQKQGSSDTGPQTLPTTAPTVQADHGVDGIDATNEPAVKAKKKKDKVVDKKDNDADLAGNTSGPVAVSAPGQSAPVGTASTAKAVVADDYSKKDLTKAVQAAVVKAVTGDLLKAALSEALKPLEDRLASVEKMAAPGGPQVGSMRQLSGPVSHQRSLLQDRIDKLTAMTEHPDPNVANGARDQIMKLASS
jgi:hypothetical protein